jgi:hypothetical protein
MASGIATSRRALTGVFVTDEDGRVIATHLGEGDAACGPGQYDSDIFVERYGGTPFRDVAPDRFTVVSSSADGQSRATADHVHTLRLVFERALTPRAGVTALVPTPSPVMPAMGLGGPFSLKVDRAGQRIGYGGQAMPLRFSFGVYGDMPYTALDRRMQPGFIEPRLRGRADIAFVIHVGDFGRPEDVCNQQAVADRLRAWKQMVKPVFFTPGDNDWTDCERAVVRPKVDALVQLGRLRDVIYAAQGLDTANWDQALAERTGIQIVPRAADAYPENSAVYPENQLWSYRGVQFVSIHMVGSDNGWLDRGDPAVVARRQAETAARQAYNIALMRAAFVRAGTEDAAALVIVTHVDPFAPRPDMLGRAEVADPRSAEQRCAEEPQYRDFCAALAEALRSSTRPVLLIHGDSNARCLDQPFRSEPAFSRFWRLNAAGDFKYVDADIVSIAADMSGPAPFIVNGLRFNQPVPDVCDYSRTPDRTALTADPLPP